jgi:hypothetical protein
VPRVSGADLRHLAGFAHLAELTLEGLTGHELAPLAALTRLKKLSIRGLLWPTLLAVRFAVPDGLPWLIRRKSPGHDEFSGLSASGVRCRRLHTLAHAILFLPICFEWKACISDAKPLDTIPCPGGIAHC